ncbi:hypothetical protein KFZ76_22720 [Methylovulum psychrotolerans]|jgi:hypothetical protein|uniref:hypothetical protein n=1 Tax=Methylovulum psychrotolerans TaxID=1704499 RepID=UPI001BFF3099|nr:hypothetical protein [Methylovulum psychrotolerans]MBT9100517.1 hypothetical protein [Methylovulum psychrotolerans]
MFGKITTALAIFALSTASAMAATSFPIDAKLNCFDVETPTVTGTPAKFELAPGRYVVSVIDNTMSCSNGGQLTNHCLIDTVILKGGLKQASWGLSVKNPTIIDVTSFPEYPYFYAFVADGICGDNTGGASLSFQKAK